jgi:hypothetical protein
MNSHSLPTIIHHSKIIGSFFLLAFLAYGFGRHFFDNGQGSVQYLGALLIVVNSLMVFLIGLLLRRTLRKFHPLVADIYLFTRIVESIALASIVLGLIPALSISPDIGYFVAMLVLGLGSIPMCWSLFTYKISPSWLAMWGVFGYAIFTLGFVLELVSLEWSMYFLMPGALWEITFALWLIVRKGKHFPCQHTAK